ncbi:ABC transporter permease subunit [Mycoplasmopsis bovigenitalium]|uniref:ABC transporter permease subunit n=1 Tax=Mycoplasmopsis bovigenitalium TaxID=2112 RepID=UPI0003A8D839|nr:ABC transporter permease subunit [Mycoplasmopsis bovigenitalium]
MIIFVILIGVCAFIGWDKFTRALFVDNINLDNSVFSVKGGLFGSLFISIVLAIFTLPFSLFISINSAVFINFRLPSTLKMYTRFFYKIIGGLSSLIFALFAHQFISEFTKIVFRLENGFNIITAVLMFILLNSAAVTNLLNKLFQGVKVHDLRYLNTHGFKTSFIVHKIIFKNYRKEIIDIAFIAFFKVVAEASAAGFILQSNNSFSGFANGFWGFLTSNPRPAATLITTSFVANKDIANIKDFSYALTLLLLLFITIVNVIFHLLNKPIRREITADKLVNKYEVNNKLKTYEKIHFWIELVTFVFLTSILIIMILALFIKGLITLFKHQTIWTFRPDSTIWSAATTLYASIFVSILVIPLCYFAAIYFNKKHKNSFISNFVNSLLKFTRGIPSVAYGLFSYFFIIDVLNLTLDATEKASLLAGVISVSIMFMPVIYSFFATQLKKLDKKYVKVAFNKGIDYQIIRKEIKIKYIVVMIITSIVTVFTMFLAETSALLITTGTHNSDRFSLFYSEMTLTTRMMQAFLSKEPGTLLTSYECCTVMIILVAFFSSLKYFALRKWDEKVNQKIKKMLA